MANSTDTNFTNVEKHAPVILRRIRFDPDDKQLIGHLQFSQNHNESTRDHSGRYFFNHAQGSVIPDSMYYIFGVMGTVVSIFGIVCNVLNILVFAKRKATKKTGSIFFMALSVFDLMYLVVFLIFGTLQVIIFRMKRETTIAAEVEDYIDGVNNLMVTGSIFITAALTVDRYIAVSKPLRWALLCSKRHTCIAVIALTITAVFVNLPLFLENVGHPLTKYVSDDDAQKSSNNEQGGCEVSNSSTPQTFTTSRLILETSEYQTSSAPPPSSTPDYSSISYYSDSYFHNTLYLKVLLPFFQLFIPGIVIVVSTLCIVLKIRHHKVGVTANENENQVTTAVNRSANRITLQVIAMATMTLLANGMIAFSFVIMALNDTVFINKCTPGCIIFVCFAHVAVALNSSMNLLLYAYFSKAFRDDIKKLLTCRFSGCRRKNVLPSTLTKETGEL